MREAAPRPDGNIKVLPIDDERRPDRFLGTSKAAAFLGLQPQTLRRWRTVGGGPRFIRLGDGPAARCVYTVAALEGWIAAHTFASSAEAFARGAGASSEPPAGR